MMSVWVVLRHFKCWQIPIRFSLTPSHNSHLPPSHILTCSALYSNGHTPYKQSRPAQGGPAHQQLAPPSDRLLRRGWQKLATLVSAFMTGTKGLYKDVKAMNELKRRHRMKITEFAPKILENGSTDFGFSSSELRFIRQTQKDMRKMLPTIILFFVPFFGYFVPLIVFMYPHHMLSSHFLTDQQRSDLAKTASTIRAHHLQSLLETRETRERLKELEEHLKVVGKRRVGGGGEDVVSDTQDGCLNWNLSDVKGLYLESLCDLWGVVGGRGLLRLLPWGRNSALQSRLESHLQYIFTTDWLISIEGGVAKRDDIDKLCVERCLVSDGERGEEGEREMVEYLEQWVSISTQFQECPPYLLAHLPLLLSQSQVKKNPNSS